MKSLLKILLILILSGFSMPKLVAQQDILSAGCDATGNGGMVTWSVGLVAYSAWSNTTGFLTEGVQQPYEIFNITGFEELKTNPGIIIFPNPTSGNVTLRTLDHNLKSLSACIFDIKGTRLRTIAIDAEEIAIPMEDLKPATYILNILEKDQLVKTYKIIKK